MVGGSSPIGGTSAPDKKPSPIADGYTVEPAGNGGWIVREAQGYEYRLATTIGAFSNSSDLLTWLAEQHKMLQRPVAIVPEGTVIPKEELLQPYSVCEVGVRGVQR